MEIHTAAAWTCQGQVAWTHSEQQPMVLVKPHGYSASLARLPRQGSLAPVLTFTISGEVMRPRGCLMRHLGSSGSTVAGITSATAKGGLLK